MIPRRSERHVLTAVPLLLAAGLAAAAPAGAEEPPVLPTQPAREWLGDMSSLLGGADGGLLSPMGEDSQLWTGTLAELVTAVAALDGTEVGEVPGPVGDVRLTLWADGPVGADGGWAAVEAACRRAGAPGPPPAGAVRLDVGDPANGGEAGAEPASSLTVMVMGDGSGMADGLRPLMEAMGLNGGEHVTSPAGGKVAWAATLEDMMSPLSADRLLSRTSSAPEFETDESGAWIVPREVVAPLAGADGLRAARVVPSYRDGALNGVKLFSIRRESPFRALGIRNGDVIVAVDDRPLDDVTGIGRLLNAWLQEDAVKVSLERRGQTLTLRYVMTGEPAEGAGDLWVGKSSTSRLREREGVTIADGRVTLPREAVDRLAADLADKVRWRYATDGAGELRGISASSSRSSFPMLIDLSVREVVTAVDGEPADTPEDLLALFQGLATRDEVELTVAGHLEERVLTLAVEGPAVAGAGPGARGCNDLPESRDQRRDRLGIRVGEEGEVRLPRAAREALLEPALTLALEPVVGEDGAVQGYRVGDWRHEGLASVLGIPRGATLRAVDGAPLDSAAAVAGLLAGWLGERKSLVLDLEADDGEARSLTFRRGGASLAPPLSWRDVGIRVEPTLAEHRALLHIEIDGDRTRVPRDVAHALMVSPSDLRSTRSREGFRPSSRESLSTWRLLGFRPSEAVTACDGEPLDRRRAEEQIATALLESPSVTLTLTGDAGERSLVIEVVEE